MSCSSSVSSNSESVSSSVAPRLGLARQDLGRHLDQVGRAAAPVAIGALAHEVDIAHRLLAAVGGGAADRHLAQHQLAPRHRLQRRQHVAHADLGGVDLVHEDDVRDAPVLDLFQERRQRHHALGRGLADEDGGIAHRERREGVVLELDRARHVEEGPLVAEIVDRGDVDLGAHAALARLRQRRRQSRCPRASSRAGRWLRWRRECFRAGWSCPTDTARTAPPRDAHRCLVCRR